MSGTLFHYNLMQHNCLDHMQPLEVVSAFSLLNSVLRCNRKGTMSVWNMESLYLLEMVLK